MSEKKEPKCNNEVIMTITNDHYDSCGVPPQLDRQDKLTAYFENDLNEQIILQYDQTDKICRLWHGDCGWDEEYRVVEINGQVVVVPFNPQKTTLDAKERKSRRRQIRMVYGKSVTDEECDLIMKSPLLDREMGVIAAIYRQWAKSIT